MIFLLCDDNEEREVECRSFKKVPSEQLTVFEEKLRLYNELWSNSQ